MIGLSGGIDSVVLLYLFSQIQSQFNLNLRAIHIHHGLSPNADRWAAFCEAYCKRLDIPFILQKVQLLGSSNLEQQAREARYQAVAQIIQQDETFVTAHHLDDQAETFMLALKRGSGVKGLSAMQAVSSLQYFAIFRPLLAFSKQDLTAYAKKNNLEWIEDESNSNTDFDRNFLRQEIMPLLNQRWHHFSQMVTRSAEHCANQQLLVEELLNDELNLYSDFAKKSFDLTACKSDSKLKQQQLLRLWLEKCGVVMPSIVQLDELLKMMNAEKDKNPQLKLGKDIIRRYQSLLFVTREFSDTSDFSVSLSPNQEVTLPDDIGEIKRSDCEIFCKFSSGTERFQLPKELAKKELKLTLSASGKVAVYGKPQREEMKKIWQQHNVPIWERTRTPLIFNENEFVIMLK